VARRALLLVGTVLLPILILPALAAAKPHRPGTLDPSFGQKGSDFHAGVIPGTLLPDGLDNFGGMAFDSAGRIVLGGDTPTPAGNDFVLGRLSKNGRFDQGFGAPATHLAVGDVNVGSDDDAEDIAAGPNGTVYVATDTDAPGGNRFGVSRVTSSGFFDNGFDGDGRTTTAIGTEASPGAIAVHNGRAVVAGQAKIGGKDRLAVVRYLPNGNPDPSFGGGDGITISPVGQAFITFDAKVQKDGKIVVAGGAQVGAPGSIRAALVRYRPNGTLDPTFGNAGVSKLRVGKFAVAFGLALGARGKLVLAGVTQEGITGFAARLTRAGKRDHSFGSGDGVVRSAFGQGFSYITDVAVQRNGKIVLAGFGGDITGVPGGILAARLTPRGRLDRGFGNRGAKLFLLGATKFARVRVGIQRNGRIVIGGAISIFGIDGFLAARLFG
jgi:uncharacterized delta-60 repeat protein